MAARRRWLASRATRLISIDRDTPLLRPPDLRDWVPTDHLVHFILDAVDALDRHQVKVNTRGTGREQYPPHLLLGLLIHSYATGIFGRRRLGQSTHDRVPVGAALVDSGFYSEAAVRQVARAVDGTPTGTVVYAAGEKTGHHRSVAGLEAKPGPEPPAADASVIEVLRHRLQTTAGRTLYKLRPPTVEPVWGTIKSVPGFRQFGLRGRAKVALEWTLVCLAYNLKRLPRLGAGLPLAAAN